MSALPQFETLTIDEATERLIDYRGKTPPKTESGVRLITAKVIKKGRILEEPKEYIAEDFYDEWMRRGLPQKHDSLITTEAPLGEVTILRNGNKIALAQRVILLRAKPGIVDSLYLFYALQSDFTQAELAARSTGTTVLGVKQSELRKVRIPYWPLPVQQRVASILSAYDELIDNNTRRIAILEEMARRIYDEWFVRFRFHGHEKVQMIPSEFGLIPKEWSFQSIGSVAELNKLSIKRDDKVEEISYIEISSVSTGMVDAVERMKFTDAPGRARRIVRHGDIIWSNVRPNRKSYALIIKPIPNLIVSTGFTVLSSVGVPFSYLYLSTTTDDFASYLTNRAKGAAYPAVGPDDFSEAQLLVPDKAILKLFNSIVEPLLKQKHVLQLINQNLRSTRDLLLPELISGEIDISYFPSPAPVKT